MLSMLPDCKNTGMNKPWTMLSKSLQKSEETVNRKVQYNIYAKIWKRIQRGVLENKIKISQWKWHWRCILNDEHQLFR